MFLKLLFLNICTILACSKQPQYMAIPVPETTPNIQAKTYLALGDSYTIGESVGQKETFPFQLTSLLNKDGVNFAQPKVIAKTGWTTGELQAAIKAENVKADFDLVTLLIGVNNQYRGNSKTVYREEFKELLQQAIKFAKGDKKHVFVVSIPDWGVTPFGKNSGRDVNIIAQEIDAFNAINKEETLAAGVTYVDITPESRKASTESALVAKDGLHPSGKMYEYWATSLSRAISGIYK